MHLLLFAIGALAGTQLHHGIRRITDDTLFVPRSDVLSIRQPLLEIGRDSCHPVPAVDVDGNWNGGLAPRGKWDGQCGGGSDNAVTYVRMSIVNATTCVRMYSWYMEKNQGVDFRQRHDFQHVVVVSDAHDPWSPVRRICVHHYNQYHCYHRYPTLKHGGTDMALILYHYDELYDRHVIDPAFDCHAPTRDDGDVYPPLMDWGRMNDAMRQTLNGAVFDNVPVPFADGNYDRNVKAALDVDVMPDPILPPDCPHVT